VGVQAGAAFLPLRRAGSGTPNHRARAVTSGEGGGGGGGSPPTNALLYPANALIYFNNGMFSVSANSKPVMIMISFPIEINRHLQCSDMISNCCHKSFIIFIYVLSNSNVE
jgi:hypothetical protein